MSERGNDDFKKWLASPAGETCMDLPLPSDEPAKYLGHRLWWAFYAGVNSVERASANGGSTP